MQGIYRCYATFKITIVSIFKRFTRKFLLPLSLYKFFSRYNYISLQKGLSSTACFDSRYLINYHSRRNFFSRFTKLSFFNISPRREKNRCVFPCFARRANDRPIVGNAFTSVRDALKKTCKASDAIVNRKSLSNQKPFRHVRHVHA